MDIEFEIYHKVDGEWHKFATAEDFQTAEKIIKLCSNPDGVERMKLVKVIKTEIWEGIV